MITIYGASDDLVEVAGCEGADEFNVYSQDWAALLIAPAAGAEEQMRVGMQYADNGCWLAVIGQADEELPFPSWPITITQAPAMNPANPGYSVLVSIDAPAGTRLQVISS